MAATSLRLVSRTDELLARAHAQVRLAADMLGAQEGFEASASCLECLEVAADLEDCGAVPSADLLAVPAVGDPRALLRSAFDLLDEIEPADRPLQLGSVRAELVAVLAGLPSGE